VQDAMEQNRDPAHDGEGEVLQNLRQQLVRGGDRDATRLGRSQTDASGEHPRLVSQLAKLLSNLRTMDRASRRTVRQ